MGSKYLTSFHIIAPCVVDVLMRWQPWEGDSLHSPDAPKLKLPLFFSQVLFIPWTFSPWVFELHLVLTLTKADSPLFKNHWFLSAENNIYNDDQETVGHFQCVFLPRTSKLAKPGDKNLHIKCGTYVYLCTYIHFSHPLHDSSATNWFFETFLIKRFNSSNSKTTRSYYFECIYTFAQTETTQKVVSLSYCCKQQNMHCSLSPWH